MHPEPRVLVPGKQHRAVDEERPRTEAKTPWREPPAPAERRIEHELERYAAVHVHVRVLLVIGDPDPAVLRRVYPFPLDVGGSRRRGRVHLWWRWRQVRLRRRGRVRLRRLDRVRGPRG